MDTSLQTDLQHGKPNTFPTPFEKTTSSPFVVAGSFLRQALQAHDKRSFKQLVRIIMLSKDTAVQWSF
jgi:hypothetical protein